MISIYTLSVICFLFEIFHQVIFSHAYSQQVIFNDKTYSFGIKPSVAQASVAAAKYNQWKADFVTSTNAGGFQRVKYPKSGYFTHTASSGIGYGMLLSAYFGDKVLFDDLFGFFKLHRNKRGMMSWYIPDSGITPADGTGEYNSATDADEDIAMSLIIADVQWGSSGSVDYKNEAALIINSLYKFCVDSASGLLKPGDVYGNEYCLNPSYFAISYYPWFAAITSNNGWITVRNKSMSILASASGLNSTGLIGDWITQSGGFPSGCNWHTSDYEYDACRIPWRVGLDYLWYGSSDSKTLCEKIINWTLSSPINGNANQIRDGYYKDGTLKTYNKNNPVIAGFQTGAMTTLHTNWLDNLYNENLLREDDWFYDRTLQLISLFIASGNFWSPSIQVSISPDPGSENMFSFFPNPSKGTFLFTPLSTDAGITELEIYNMTGEKISFEILHTYGKQLLIDLTNHPEGIYLALIKNEHKINYRKLVISQ